MLRVPRTNPAMFVTIGFFSSQSQSAALRVPRPQPPPRMHFHRLRHRPPKVWLTFGSPLIGPLTHRRRRRDRVDSNYFIEAVCDSGNRLVGVVLNSGFMF